jgi:hypothetical protein
MQMNYSNKNNKFILIDTKNFANTKQLSDSVLYSNKFYIVINLLLELMKWTFKTYEKNILVHIFIRSVWLCVNP